MAWPRSRSRPRRQDPGAAEPDAPPADRPSDPTPTLVAAGRGSQDIRIWPANGLDAALAADLAGRYRIGEVIGRGAMAAVHVAEDTVLGRRVAIKLFHDRAHTDTELRLQEAEAKVVATFNHYALTTLFDAGIDTRDPEHPRIFLVMELVDGTDLRRRLAEGPIPPVQVCWLGADLADGLDHMHRAGFLHRDVKPANVLLFPEETGRRLRGKLSDFGIASIIGRAEDAEFTSGTAAYLSPEQVDGQDARPESDVYALGLVLLEALTGKAGFPGSMIVSAMARLDRDPEIPASVPIPIADILRGMTARRPEDRLSLQDAASGLQSYLVDEIVRMRAVDPTLLAPNEAQRIAALRRYDVLDSPPDETYDAITRLAGRMLQVPIALITLVDIDRVWFKSRQGWEDEEGDRNISFCATTNPGTGHPWSIPDATRDPRTRDNPMVIDGPQLRAYAAAPLTTHDGHNLGALCVFDKEPRPFTDVELENLEDLAGLVMHELELRLATRRAVLDR
jgi:serine/threonine protein kinase